MMMLMLFVDGGRWLFGRLFSFLIIMCECGTFYMMPNSVGR